MMGTALAIAFALFLRLYSQPILSDTAWPILFYSMILLSISLLILQTIIQFLAWKPMIQAAAVTTPRIADLVYKDLFLRVINLYLILFPLVTLILIVSSLFLNFNRLDLFTLWIVLFGVSLDALYFTYRRVQKYLNPFAIIKILTKTAKHDVQKEAELDLIDCIDAISEMATKSIETSSIALPNESLNELQRIIRNFLDAAKSIAHITLGTEEKKLGAADAITYPLYFLYQRLELIHDKALDKKLEPVCTSVITTLGKIVIHASKFDISLCSVPIHVLGRCSLKAQENGLPEIGQKAVVTLLEVARTIINEVDVRYFEIKEAFGVLVTDMHEISKVIFKNNKEMEIDNLRQPFKELKELFSTEKMKSHQDTPEILARISQVLAEMDALELVLKTIPPLTTIEEEDKPSGEFIPPTAPEP